MIRREGEVVRTCWGIFPVLLARSRYSLRQKNQHLLPEERVLMLGRARSYCPNFQYLLNQPLQTREEALPFNRRNAVLLQVGVRLREMVVAEETAVGGERRGMGGGEDEVARAVDERPLLLRVTSPEEEDNVAALLGKFADNGIGECLPPVSRMRGCLVRADGEGRVEE